MRYNVLVLFTPALWFFLSIHYKFMAKYLQAFIHIFICKHQPRSTSQCFNVHSSISKFSQKHLQCTHSIYYFKVLMSIHIVIQCWCKQLHWFNWVINVLTAKLNCLWDSIYMSIHIWNPGFNQSHFYLFLADFDCCFDRVLNHLKLL
jgi:hypothetical protein